VIWKRPNAQPMHEDWPGLDCADPAPQLAHSVAPADENDPAAQTLVEDVSPADPQ